MSFVRWRDAAPPLVPALSVVVDPQPVEGWPTRDADNRCGGSHSAYLRSAKERALPKCL